MMTGLLRVLVLPSPSPGWRANSDAPLSLGVRHHAALVYEYFNADGRHHRARGIAKFAEGSARLRVSFFRPFYGDCWVLALDSDYRGALACEPRRRCAWVLARNPHLDDATREALLTRIEEPGFDRAAFASTPHTQP